MSLTACTIISKNYLAFARVLVDSFLEHHPDGRFFVLLVDRNEGHIDPAAERFELLEIEELAAERGGNVAEMTAFLFKYSLLECNTAIKPFLLEHLFEHHRPPSLIYFDPDILITRRLDALGELLERHSIVLTPHLDRPIDDGAHPGELAVLQAGAYNLGFLGLRRDDSSRRLLAWWRDRLYERCVVRVEEGLFVDQKWIDLVPGLFEGVCILRDPGYNVAYWNLHGRPITIGADGARAAGEPLFFFHFSGIDPDALEQVSKHQDRYRLSDVGAAAELYRDYRDRLLTAGHREAQPWPYAFGRFDNGAPVPDVARRLYLDLGPRRRRRFGDPFAAGGEESFFRWLNEPVDPRARKPPYLTRLLHQLYLRRDDLQRIFPDVAGADFYDFCSWLEGFGRYEFRIDDAFLGTVHRESRATLFTLGGLKRRLVHRAKRAYHSAAAKRLRRFLKRTLGHRRARELRDQLRPRPAAQPALLGRPRRPLAAPVGIERVGINLVGYARAETGMGQGVRSLAHALETTGLPFTLNNLDLNVLARSEDRSLDSVPAGYPYDVNLFFVNADQVAPVAEHLGGEVFAGRYNVGFWLWELERFPEEWLPAFDLLHEVWTPSSFCVEAISRVSPIPVRRLPLPVEPRPTPGLDRRHFGLPEDDFLVLYLFSFLSYVERKNPVALVRAFRRAFRPDEPATLVLKTSQADFAPDARRRLEAEIGDARVRILDDYLRRDEVDALIGACDAYASLHRSEGFGLTLAEAMALGKPVVATPYSGVSDFFHLDTGYPVRYRKVEIEEDAGPYRAGGVWAEADVDHAAELLREVYEERAEARARGERARRTVRAELAYATVGARLRELFEGILRESRRRGLGRRL